MHDLPPEIEVYPVQHLPMLQADADQRGLIRCIHHDGPTALDVDAGPVVLGVVVDTLRGRSPLSRLAAYFAHQDTARLLGQAIPPHAGNDEAVGRVRDRLADVGTMTLITAWAVRAPARFGLECCYVPCETTSRRVWGEDQCAEEQDVPFRMT